jgi:exosome complex component RRP46
MKHVQNLPILPALLQTAVLALLSASIPLAMTLTSVFLALDTDGAARKVIQHPTIHQIQTASSIHVLGFTSQGDLLVVESEGNFAMEDWDDVYEAGKTICCDDPTNSNDHEMLEDEVNEKSRGMQMFVKSALQAKVAANLHWKD